MLRRILILATAAALLPPLAAQPVADRWEKDIQAFEASQAAIEPGGVVVIGTPTSPPTRACVFCLASYFRRSKASRP